MSKHTPGPWLMTDELVYALDETGSINRFTALVQRGKVTYRGEPTSKDELHANARLIAAAPDILVALRDAEKVMDKYVYPKPDVGPDHPWSVLERVRYAIARAEGREA